MPMFVLPELPRSARVLGPLQAWREGLAQAQIADAPEPDLVVAPAKLAVEATTLRPRTLILEGRARRAALGGYSARVLVPIPNRDAPEVLLPAGDPALVRYALGGPRSARVRVARTLLERGLVPPVLRQTTLAARDAGPPALVAAAAAFAPEVAGSSWLPLLGRWGDALSRGVLLLFPFGVESPRWALKFARVPGNARPFELDERGLGVAAAAGGIVAAHAPRLLGRFRVGRLEASLETATVGRRLLAVLGESGTREQKLAQIERIAGWIEAVARETRGSPSAREDRPGAPGDLVDAVASVPSVLEHGDLWPDNIVVDHDSFGLLDWESARAGGFPLWDLFYFLNASLALLDGSPAADEYFVRLWRGELPSSVPLFDWTRRVAAAAGVPHEAVGPLATLRLLWLAHEELEHAERAGSTETPLSVRQSQLWLADPELGAGWDSWRP
jgi:hypothetical protein